MEDARSLDVAERQPNGGRSVANGQHAGCISSRKHNTLHANGNMMRIHDIAISRKWVPAVALGTFLLVAAGTGSEASAGGWMFQRSYHSHAVPSEKAADYPRPRSRSAYRRAFTGSARGVAIRGGYRYKRLYMRSGNSTDLTVIREDWFDLQP